jgi:hypothetical protein
MINPKGFSPLAHLIDRPRDTTDRSQPVFGLVVHTSGRGLVAQAKKHHADPLEFATDYYTGAEYWPHYVMGYDGTTIQLANDFERAPHVGFADQRQAYLNGTWVKQLPVPVTALWRARWDGYRSPAHLFPGPSVNDVYVGLELLPLEKPNGYGHLFTPTQHVDVAGLYLDLIKRHGLPPSARHDERRLVGHEDVNPITRHDAHGGWDPGSLRDKPYFSWSLVNTALGDPYP